MNDEQKSKAEILVERDELRERLQKITREQEQTAQSLRRSEEKFSQAFHLAPVPMTISAIADGTIIDVNQAFLERTGYVREEIVGRSTLEFGFIREDERQKVVAALSEKGQIDALELEIFTASGTRHDVLYSGHLVDIGGVPRMLSTAIDITEQKQLVAEQEITIELLRLMSGVSDLKDLMLDVTELLQGWSGCDAIGIRLKKGDDYPYFESRGFTEEFVFVENSVCDDFRGGGERSSGTGAPRLSCLCGAVLQQRVDPSKPYFTENGSFWTNSTTKWRAAFEDSALLGPLRNRCNAEGYESMALVPLRHGEEILGLLQLNDRRRNLFRESDIARIERLASKLSIGLSHRLVVEALKESEARLTMAFEGTGAGNWELELSGNRITVSDQWARHLGYDESDIPRTVEEVGALLHPDDLNGSQEAMAAYLSGDSDQFEVESRIRRKDGDYIWVATRAKLAERDKEGNPKRLVGITFDITKQKHAEQEREKLQEELAQAHKMESVGRLAGGVAHDFNNMLGVILGHAELALRKEIEGSATHVHLGDIKKAAIRSAELTRQLLAFARKQTTAPHVLDVNGKVGGMLDMLQRLIGESIVLDWRPAKGLWPVRIDPSQIDQILANLCINARDAIEEVGTIVIRTENVTLEPGHTRLSTGGSSREFVLLSVRDDGQGMNEETLSHLFEPFYTTKGVGEGTGLGLATVYGTVKQNEGLVEVESEPGKGTTFSIYLPRYEGALPKRALEAPDAAAAKGRETILLVEDEPSVLDLGQAMLEGLGYHVIAANGPREALQKAEAHTGEIQLLLTDVIMPEMNGRELAGKLLSRYPNMKQLYMSGYSASVIARRGVVEEGVHFLHKPFLANELSEKVRQALETI